MEGTAFFEIIKSDENKLKLFKEGLSDGRIQPFDQETISKLRRVYYSCLNGVLYLYGMPINDGTIGNKMEILSYIFQDEDFKIVHGHTDSSKQLVFPQYNKNKLDCNSWIEVSHGAKVWVYDTISMLKFEKDIFYKLENPDVFRIVPKAYIEAHPARSDEDDDYFYYPHDKWLLLDYIPNLEKIAQIHPYKEILLPEIARYKQEIDFDRVAIKYGSNGMRL